MTTSYDQFKLAIYCTAHCLDGLTVDDIRRDVEFFRAHLRVSKVYVESHRGDCSVDRQRLAELKALFESLGMVTAGGITPTLPASYRPGFERMFGSICYTDEASRAKLRHEVEVAASVFDEIILDDFFFTSCTCDACAARRGSRSWSQMRLDLMIDVSENVIIKPAKAVNPNVKLVIKYPNWCESYHSTGYDTERQVALFDGIYCGTETRDPATSQQHIARYASYSLLQWFEQLSDKGVGGAWFDALDCGSIDGYLEQAYLSVFGKARELTLYNYTLHRDSVYVPALGFQLRKLDGLAGGLGKPTGVRAYLPHRSAGEDHWVDTLGMAGISIVPTAHFPSAPGKEVALLTAAAASDPNLIPSLRRYLTSGGIVVMTSGLVAELSGKGIEAFTSLVPDRHAAIPEQYGIRTNCCTFDEFWPAVSRIRFQALRYATNASWPVVVGFDGAYNVPVLTWDNVGRGRLYTLCVPDNPVDLLKLPVAVLDEIRTAFAATASVFVQGPAELALFMYDNQTFVIESFARVPQKWRVCVKDCAELRELGPDTSPLVAHRSTTDTSEFEVRLAPGSFRAFQWQRRTAKGGPTPAQ
jgi:hypothetical protein